MRDFLEEAVHYCGNVEKLADRLVEAIEYAERFPAVRVEFEPIFDVLKGQVQHIRCELNLHAMTRRGQSECERLSRKK